MTCVRFCVYLMTQSWSPSTTPDKGSRTKSHVADTRTRGVYDGVGGDGHLTVVSDWRREKGSWMGTGVLKTVTWGSSVILR